MQWPIFLGYAALFWLVFVKLKIVRLSFPIADNTDIRLPAGAREEAAVYTDKIPFAGMLRKGLIRTDTIVNYLKWGT